MHRPCLTLCVDTGRSWSREQEGVFGSGLSGPGCAPSCGELQGEAASSPVS